MKKILIVAVALWSSVLFFTSHVSADIFDTYGFGAKGMAMGGAICSVADGATSVFYNTAGLAKNKGFDLDVSYFRTYPSMDINVDTSGAEDDVNLFLPKDSDLEFGMFTLGLALNLNLLANLPLNTTLGMGLATLDDMTLAVLEDVEESQYAYVQFGAPLQLITPYFGLGIEILPEVLYIGIGGHAMITGSASANVTLETDGLSTETPVEPASQDIWMTMDGAIEPMFGVAFHMGGLGFGFSYKEEISVDVDEFLAYLDLELGSTVARIPAALAIISNWNPTVYQFGGSYQTESFTVSLDIRQEKWSDFSRGPARDARRTAPEFDDITSYHLGAEYKLMENMRGWVGYSIVPSPVPNQALASNYLANDRNIYSCGGEMQLRDPFGIAKFPIWIGGAVQYQKLKKATIHKEEGSGLYDVSHKGDVWSIVFSARVSYDATSS